MTQLCVWVAVSTVPEPVQMGQPGQVLRVREPPMQLLLMSVSTSQEEKRVAGEWRYTVGRKERGPREGKEEAEAYQ